MARLFTVTSTAASFASESAASESIRVANGWDDVAVTAPEQIEPGVFAVWAYETDEAMHADATGNDGERIEIRS